VEYDCRCDEFEWSVVELLERAEAAEAEVARLREGILSTADYVQLTMKERGPDMRLVAIENTLRDLLKLAAALAGKGE
jgi:hypothetical protein